ncbi:MAG: hypothetical protein COB65_03965 [Thalassobium sp.]|nr:MAG: hypothetical protein COB65_03965 [Thalassobium sp.]
MLLNKKFHFIHIPKTGGMSVDSALSDWDGRSPRNWTNRLFRKLRAPLPWRYALLKRHDSISLANQLAIGITATSFSIVRDPYTHAVSHYKHIQRHADRYPREVRGMSINSFLEWRLVRSGFISQELNGSRWFAKMSDQYSFLEQGGEIAVDHLISFENLEKDLADFCEVIGLLPPNLPHLNASADTVELDERGVDLVNQIYRRDFDAFGYTRR